MHKVMLGCLCKAFLREEGAHIWKMEKLEIRAVIKYFSKKGMPPKEIHEDFMETLGKESPSYKYSEKRQQSLRGRESVENDGRSGRPKDATADENVNVVHTLLMCDSRRDQRSRHTFWGTTINPNRHLRYVKGFSKMGAANDDRKSEKDLARYFLVSLLSRYEDDPGDFIERVVTQDETWLHHFDPESKIQSKQWTHPGLTPS